MPSSNELVSRIQRDIHSDQVKTSFQSNSSLESYLSNAPTLSPEKLREVISYAYQLESAEINAAAHQRVISDLEIKTLEETKREDNEIEIASMLRVAKDLGELPDEKYIQRALQLYHPSVEEKRHQIEKAGSTPSKEIRSSKAMKRIYNFTKEISLLLAKEIPNFDIELDNYRIINSRKLPPTNDGSDLVGYCGFYNSIYLVANSTKEIRPFFTPWRKKKVANREKIKIAQIDFFQNQNKLSSLEINITYQKSIFLQVCGDIMDKLENYFPGYFIDKRKSHTYDEEE